LKDTPVDISVVSTVAGTHLDYAAERAGHVVLKAVTQSNVLDHTMLVDGVAEQA
jgi:hypothetical protein